VEYELLEALTTQPGEVAARRGQHLGRFKIKRCLKRIKRRKVYCPTLDSIPCPFQVGKVLPITDAVVFVNTFHTRL